MTALQGIRVLELAESVAGEYCGKLLADFGCEIIKIERPDQGSPSRRLGPFKDNTPGLERSGLFAYLNTGKHSITLDLESDTTALQALLDRVDVVIDDHSAAWLDRRGLSAEQAEKKHPGLTVCSITDFGLNPPDDRQHASDLTVFHSSGWGYHTPTGADPKRPPLKGAGRFMPSYEAGLEAALCISAALVDAFDSHQGRFIEISKQEVLLSRIDYVLGQMIAGDMEVSTDRAAFDLAGPAGIFACRDGFAYIWMSAPAHWKALRELLDETEWMNDFPDNWLERGCTSERVALCRQQLGKWLRSQNKHDAATKAQQLGLTLVAVNNARDLIACEQFEYRGYFTELDHWEIGPVKYPTTPYSLSLTPARPRAPAPRLGEHSDQLSQLTGGAQ